MRSTFVFHTTTRSKNTHRVEDTKLDTTLGSHGEVGAAMVSSDGVRFARCADEIPEVGWRADRGVGHRLDGEVEQDDEEDHCGRRGGDERVRCKNEGRVDDGERMRLTGVDVVCDKGRAKTARDGVEHHALEEVARCGCVDEPLGVVRNRSSGHVRLARGKWPRRRAFQSRPRC